MASRTEGGTYLSRVHLDLDLLAILQRVALSPVLRGNERIRFLLFFHFCGQKSFDLGKVETSFEYGPFEKGPLTFLLSHFSGSVHQARCR